MEAHSLLFLLKQPGATENSREQPGRLPEGLVGEAAPSSPQPGLRAQHPGERRAGSINAQRAASLPCETGWQKLPTPRGVVRTELGRSRDSAHGACSVPGTSRLWWKRATCLGNSEGSLVLCHLGFYKTFFSNHRH